jgi:hypothetical protein
MGKKKPKMLQGSDYNVWVVVDLANSYYEMSATFTSNLPTTVEGLMEQRFLGVASATNRILALELYLKAVLVGQRGPFPATHDLVVLFGALPEFIRQDAERRFNERIQATHKGPNWALRYFLGVGLMPSSAEREKAERAVPPSEDSLAGLLERNKNRFVDSRYLFEYAKSDQPFSFNYELRALAILCSIMCEGLERAMQDQNPGYVRRFRFEPAQPTFARTDYTFFKEMTGRPTL